LIWRIASSKPAAGSRGNGGWQLFLETDKSDGIHYLCFKTDDGDGYHLLKAPLNNLYDDKYKRIAQKANVDYEKSKDIFKEYTHVVAAVRSANGSLSLYVNGNMLAKVTPYEINDTGMRIKRFQLKGIYKESIERPTRYFTTKRMDHNYKVGYSDWNHDEFTQLGSDFTIDNTHTKEIGIEGQNEQKARGITKIIVKEIINEIPASGMIASDRIVLSIQPNTGTDDQISDGSDKAKDAQKVKVLAQFSTNATYPGLISSSFFA
jgi:hypothetical protein